MIVFNNVGKSYDANGRPPVPVLEGINLEIGTGEFLCLLGPSGCGKTTLLHLAAGFIAPSSGCILLDGGEVAGAGPDRGVVFQDANLFPWLTVLKNVEFGLKCKKMRKKERREAALDCLRQTGMADHAHKYPHALSGGMRQRAAIARVLALEPKVMLMDEPFSALDANTREHLQDELLHHWRGGGRTVIYVTHSVDEAARLADRIVIMGDTKTGIYADIRKERKSGSTGFSMERTALKKELREYMKQLPCCITR